MIIDFNVNSIGGGGIATDPEAVKYIEQDLTAEQKAQARENLDIPYPLVTYTPSGSVDPLVSPADYATEEELNQLSQKVTTRATSVSDALYAVRAATGSDSLTDNPNGTRLRMVFRVQQGDIIRLSTTFPGGYSCGIWDNPQHCVYASGSVGMLQNLINGYTTEAREWTAQVDGYLGVSLSNGSSAISDSLKQTMLDSMSVYVGSQLMIDHIFTIPSLIDRVDGIEGDVYYKRTIEISWVNNLMAEASNFRTRNGKRCSLPILLRSGESVNITTAGDGGYVMYPIVQVSGPTATVANSYPCTGLIAQIDSSSHRYKYTATADVYICLSGASDCVVSFDLENDSKIDVIEEELKISAQRLKGKNVFLFGDSLTANSTAGVFGFGERIADDAALPYRAFVYDSADGNTADVVVGYPTLTNYAKDGTTLRTKTGRNDSVLDRVKRHILQSTDADFVLVEMPVNDAAQENRNLGVMEESYTAVFDTDTQLGALEELCRYITEIGTPVKFGCFIPWKVSWVSDDWFDPYIQVFEKWGVPYLDLRKISGFNLKDCSAHRNLYSLSSDSYATWSASTTYNLDDKVKYGGQLYKCNTDGVVGVPPTDTTYWTLVSSSSADGTHLNTLGNAVVVGKILSFIESL